MNKKIRTPAEPKGKSTLVTSLAALVLSLLLGALILWINGYSPIESYSAIFVNSLSTPSGIALSLSQATPILFTGLSFAVAYKVRMINTGAEGQLYMGAMASAIVGVYLSSLPKILHLPLTLAAGVAAGGIVALFVAGLKVKFGSSEIITTLMLNEIIILFTSYLVNGPLKAAGTSMAQTEKICKSAVLTKLIPKSQLTTAIFLAVGLAIILQIVMKKSVFGYEMKVTGLNVTAAKNAGINVPKTYLITFAISGAIAGLCGSSMVMGTNYRFVEGFSPKFGFAGISVAALAAYNPVAVILSAILFGVLKAGAITLNRTTLIPIEFVDVIQVLVVIFVAAPKLINSILEKFSSIKGFVFKKLHISKQKGVPIDGE